MAIEIKNIERLLNRLNKVEYMDIKPAIKDCTLLVEGQAKELCSGELRESIHPKVEEVGELIIGTVYTQKEYAPYVEFGTGPKGSGTYPYTIKGFTLEYRSTKWCYTKDDGKTFIWTRGQKAQPFMYPALKMNEKIINDKIKSAINEHINKCCGGGK